MPEIETLEEMRAYLHRAHGVSVGMDDPVLLLHSMHRVFLADYQRLLEKHNQALTATIGGAIMGLTKEALSEHLQNQVRLADRIQSEFERQYKRAKMLSIINIIASFVCVPVLVAILMR